MSETTEVAASDAVNTDDLAELLRQAKAELATKNAERNTAEERATRAERERDEARGSAVSQAEARFLAEEAAVAGRIDGFEREAAGLERDQAAAMAEGRFEDAAKMSRQMAVIEARRQKDADYLTFLATKKEEVKRQAEMPAPQQQRQQGVDLSQFSAKQRAWIDAHPEYLTDERLRQKAAAGHALAMADGIGLDTPEYFARIEDVVGIRTDGEETKSRRRDYEDTGDLPVQRNGSPGTQRRDGAIRLTPDEREAADMAFSDVPIDDYTEGGVTKPGRYKMYARNKEALKREGRL